ncbi:hypothetical protein HID58_057793 [Brassica napus]|uniref:Uncharacterized protein n=1 Tax=Brassica napus TaxID=3708 RepID=A0ABQ7XHU4_BRANA|nr:hypothetical protein HID58_057793 [Brassica napus]
MFNKSPKTTNQTTVVSTHWLNPLLQQKSPPSSPVVHRSPPSLSVSNHHHRSPLNRRTIITANPENVEHILKTNFCNFPKGKPFTDLLGDLLGGGIFNSDGELWSSQRKLASHEFTMRSLREFTFEILREEVETRLIPAFDVVAAAISARRATEPVNAVWKLKRFFNVGSEKEAQRSDQDRARVHKQDLLSRFLAAGHDEEAVRDSVISFIMAGRDTTSAAMTWLFWLLSENDDDVEKKILEEVRNKGSLGLGCEDLREMSYTKACLCEAMRLYPPVAWDSKHAANDDVLPDGTHVKEGDKVTYFPYGMGRMEKVWGQDWDQFKPTAGLMKNQITMKYVVGWFLSRFEIIPLCKNPPVFVPLLTAHMAGGLR